MENPDRLEGMNTHDRVDTAPPASGEPGFDDLVARTRGVQPWRRVFHALNGLSLALVPGALGITSSFTALVLGGVTAVLFALDLMRLRAPRLNEAFFRSFASLASPREATAVASSSWYALGATVVYALLPMPLAAASLLVLGLADPAASVVGRLWGRRPLGKGSRLGAATFAVVAWGCLVAVLPGGSPAALAAVAVAVAGVEVLPIGVDDNLSIPLAVGALLWIVQTVPT